MSEERTWTCICHRIDDPPCWWCWWIEEFDNLYEGEDPEPGLYEEWELEYDL